MISETIDFDKLYTTFINLAKYIIGDHLSSNEADNNDPTVIRERETSQEVAFHYATVNVTDVGNTHDFEYDDFIEDDGSTTYATEHRVFITYRVYGDNAQPIASKLYDAFRKNSTLKLIETSMPNVSFQKAYEMLSLPIIGSTQYIEQSSFDVELLVSLDINDKFSKTAKNVQLNTTLKYSPDGAPAIESVISLPSDTAPKL